MKALIYLLQVSACTGIFYLFYFAFLRKLTFFTLNRWYLLGTLVLSFVIPRLHLPVDAASPVAVIRPAMYINQMQVINEPFGVYEPTVREEQAFDWLSVFRWFYLAVAAACAVHLLVSLALFMRRRKNRVLAEIEGVRILQSGKSGGNSSFLNTIFIADGGLDAAEIRQIIAHEMLHIRLRHSADRIIARLVQVVLWFNPFVYSYIRSIGENHEFEVDRIAAADTDKSGYAELLLKLSVSGHDLLMHSFSRVPLKSRIAMLFNQPSSNMNKIIYALMLPVVAVSCLAFANLKNSNGPDDHSLKSGGENKNANLSALKRDIAATGASVSVAADSPVYRQKVYNKDKMMGASQASPSKFNSWTKTAEYKRDSAAAASIGDKTLSYTVLGMVDTSLGNSFVGRFKGYKLRRGNTEYLLQNAHGQSKTLTGLLKPGEEVDIMALNVLFGNKSPLVITPKTITRNGSVIYRLTKEDLADKNPFLYEANRVRFTYGKVMDVKRYANGKWKSAVVVKENGYRIRFNVKPDAPAFSSIKEGDEVTFRFVHEVKTGAKEYMVNDWVALSNTFRDYGVKNPDFFYKFYEKI